MLLQLRAEFLQFGIGHPAGVSEVNVRGRDCRDGHIAENLVTHLERWQFFIRASLQRDEPQPQCKVFLQMHVPSMRQHQLCRRINASNVMGRWPISPSCSINRISAMGCDALFALPAAWRSFTRTMVQNAGLIPS